MQGNKGEYRGDDQGREVPRAKSFEALLAQVYYAIVLSNGKRFRDDLAMRLIYEVVLCEYLSFSLTAVLPRERVD